ncbi:WD40 repeat domain-containing protein [Kitasatospora sp. NPDC093679]|uniref:WD40 repeat domain-containing protein n=1 Tax=Kitasatospora sp. NPDC093679 TaxID=3154983 RepID=UPI003417A216
MRDGGLGGDGGFDKQLALFAEDLRRLRIECGGPSYAKISRLAPKEQPLSNSAIGEILTGKYLPGVDPLMALVRILLTVGADRPPARTDPRLAEWRSRWTELKIRQSALRNSSTFAAPAVDQPTSAVPAGSTDSPAPTGAADGVGAPSSVLLEQGVPVRAVLNALQQRALVSVDLAVEDTGIINSIAFSPDGALLAAAARRGSSVRLWETATLEPAGQLRTGHVDGAIWIGFSPAGGVLASAGNDGSVRLLDTATGMPLGQFPTYIPRIPNAAARPCAFSLDGRLLAIQAEARLVHIRDAASGDLVCEITTGDDNIDMLAFASNGLLATGHSVGLHLWDPVTGAVAGKLSAGNNPTKSISFGAANVSEASALAATVSYQKPRTVRLYDLNTLAQIADFFLHSPEPSYSLRAVFSPDGRILAASTDETLIMFDTTTREIVHIVLVNRRSPLAFSPSGRLLAAANSVGLGLWILPAAPEPS